jgi:hypothetical protein
LTCACLAAARRAVDERVARCDATAARVAPLALLPQPTAQVPRRDGRPSLAGVGQMSGPEAPADVARALAGWFDA